MRIGIFTDTYIPDINGVVSSEVTLMKALERAGHTVFLITNHPGTKVVMEDNILKLPGLVLKSLYGYKLSFPMNFTAQEYVAGMHLDIAHIQTDFGVGFFARQFAKLHNIPAVYTYHTMYEDYTHYVNPLGLAPVEKAGRNAIRSLSRVLSNTVQGVIAPSVKTKETLQAYGVVAPIYVVPTGLNLSAFSAKNLDLDAVEQIRKDLGWQPEWHSVVFVGRVAEEKSIDMLIDAVACSQDENLHLIIVGDGPNLKDYQQQAANRGVENRVHFAGKAAPSMVPLYYAAFDIFASASLSETQGMTYLEALAAGKMVAGRRDEVLQSLIEEGKTGYYFDSAQELADKLALHFARDAAEIRENEQACRQRVVPYTDEIFASKALAVYEQAIDDYKHTYTVEKIRVFDDFVHLGVQRDADKEQVKFFIPMDDFFTLKISIDTKLDAYLVNSFLEMQPYYNALRRVKQRLQAHDYTRKEVVEYCIRKLNLDARQASALADEMVQRHLLDDHAYAMDKADYWHSCGQSRTQIERKLQALGIPQDSIEEAVSWLEDETELKNALALARRLTRSIKEQSQRMKRNTIKEKLLARGYSLEIARQASDMLEISDSDEEAFLSAYNKARRMYSSLPADKRILKIRQYCARKGFSGQMLETALEGEEQADEN